MVQQGEADSSYFETLKYTRVRNGTVMFSKRLAIKLQPYCSLSVPKRHQLTAVLFVKTKLQQIRRSAITDTAVQYCI